MIENLTKLILNLYKKHPPQFKNTYSWLFKNNEKDKNTAKIWGLIIFGLIFYFSFSVVITTIFRLFLPNGYINFANYAIDLYQLSNKIIYIFVPIYLGLFIYLIKKRK